MAAEERRAYGKGQRSCQRCGTHTAIIRRYDLYYCRRCFSEIATQLGFRKY